MRRNATPAIDLSAAPGTPAKRHVENYVTGIAEEPRTCARAQEQWERSVELQAQGVLRSSLWILSLRMNFVPASDSTLMVLGGTV